MAEKKKYEEYLYYLSTLLKQEDFYSTYSDYIAQGKNSFQISQRFQKQIFDESWIDTLEDCIVALDTIVRNPRKFIVVEEDIVDISLARSISVESVKHLHSTRTSSLPLPRTAWSSRARYSIRPRKRATRSTRTVSFTPCS